jgi:hypothetical protein
VQREYKGDLRLALAPSTQFSNDHSRQPSYASAPWRTHLGSLRLESRDEHPVPAHATTGRSQPGAQVNTQQANEPTWSPQLEHQLSGAPRHTPNTHAGTPAEARGTYNRPALASIRARSRSSVAPRGSIPKPKLACAHQGPGQTEAANNHRLYHSKQSQAPPQQTITGSTRATAGDPRCAFGAHSLGTHLSLRPVLRPDMPNLPVSAST